MEECKTVIREERERNKELEGKRKELEERVNKFQVPDRGLYLFLLFVSVQFFYHHLRTYL